MLQKTLHRTRFLLLSLALAGLLLVLVTISVSAQPASLVVQPDSSSVAPGQTVLFTTQYSPPGQATVGVSGQLSATWSSNAELVQRPTGAENQVKSNEVIWRFEDRLPEQLPDFTLQALDEPGPIQVRVTLVITDSQNEVSKLVSDPAQVQITPAVAPQLDGSPVLATSKLLFDPPNQVAVGSNLTVTVVLSNTGDAPASEVVVSVIPDSPAIVLAVSDTSIELVEEVSSIDNAIAFRLKAPLEAETEQSIELEVPIPIEFEEGPLQFDVTVEAVGLDKLSLQGTVTILTSPTAQLTLAFPEQDPPIAGSPLLVKLRLENSGTVPVDKVKLRVSPSVPIDLSTTGEGIVSTREGTELILDLTKPLATGEARDITLNGKAPGTAGPLTIEAVIEESDPPLGQDTPNTANRIVDVQPLPTVAPTSMPTTLPVPTATATLSSTVASPEATSAPEATPPASPATGPFGWLIPALAVILLAIVAIVVALVLLRRSKKGSTTAPVTPSTAPLVPIPPPPSPTSAAYLESVSVPGKATRIKDGVTTIGRDPDCDIRITEEYPNWETVSRRHAEIRREGGAYVIYDVSNKNGLYVQGLRTAKNLLRPGTPIAIGGVEFVFYDSTATGQ